MSTSTPCNLPPLRHHDAKQLNLALLKAQLQLRAEHRPSTRPVSASPLVDKPASVLVLVSGIELAGKSEAVIQLREWMDARYLKVKAALSRNLSPNQPFWQPYIASIPAQGQIVVLFGNWYGDLIHSALHDRAFTPHQCTLAIAQMRQFEQYLQDNGVTLIKCWFDLSWACLQQRLDALDKSARHWQQLHGLDWRKPAQYDKVQAVRNTFTQDWFVIPGEQAAMRDLLFGNLVLETLNGNVSSPLAALQSVTPKPPSPKPAGLAYQQHKVPACLLRPSEQQTQKPAYQRALPRLQQQVAAALRQCAAAAGVVLVFEGMDAAGKGGAIQRLVGALDPREYEIHSIAAPESEELKRPYLWRFWNRLPPPGGIGIFDRSWYGRVLVERVEQLASPQQWQRAYAEINQFEHALAQSGILVIKCWLGISKDEQLKRFNARAQDEHKQYKLTPEDWRNREKWSDYLNAAADMLTLTSTAQAPWHIIASNDKRTARLAVFNALLKQLKQSP